MSPRIFAWNGNERSYNLVELLRLLKMSLLVKDIYWAKKLIANSINSRDVRYDSKSGNLFLKCLNINIRKDQNLFLLQAYHYAILLANERGAQFTITAQGEVFINVAGLRVNIQTVGQVYNLKEQHIDGIYNLLFSGPVVVWDIGMNVGLASLNFASKSDVIVLGYEPFKETYEQALYNISLNPQLSNKIRTFNVGISDENGKVLTGYNPEIADVLGFYGPPENYTKTKNLDLESEEIELRNAQQVLDSIVADYPSRSIIAKIDCEGSEYRIIDALAATGKLQMLEAIMVEWHIREQTHKPTTIARILLEVGFKVFLFRPHNKTSGMLYAVRGSNKH